MSQPLIETCLRIPTYVHYANGRDRAAARQAFSDLLPRVIATRRSKGMMEEYAEALFMHNVQVARSLLLDGLLVPQKLVDRARGEEALSQRPSGIIKGVSELYHLVETEAWLQKWKPIAA